MRRASIVEITPRERAPYWIVTVAGRGDLCRIFRTNAIDAIRYARTLNNWRTP